MKQSITVKLKLGEKYDNIETTLLHITEIHYLYHSHAGKRNF